MMLTYVCNPFFFHPLKLPAQLAFGCDYERAYRHFRQGHRHPLNILLHLGALCLSALANFALLHALTDALAPGLGTVDLVGWRVSPVAGLTAASWALLVLCQPACPWPVRVAAACFVVGACELSLLVRPLWRTACTLEGGLHALYLRHCNGAAIPAYRSTPVWALALGRYALQALVLCAGVGSLAAARGPVNALVGAYMLAGSVQPFIDTSAAQSQAEHNAGAGKRLTVFWAGPCAWALALLTDQPWLYFYGAGFSATLVQGVAHAWTSEMGTVPNIVDAEFREKAGPGGLLTAEYRRAKTGDELSHFSFFPALILHSAYESLRG